MRVTTAYSEDAELNGYYISVSLLLAGDIATNTGPGTEHINPKRKTPVYKHPCKKCTRPAVKSNQKGIQCDSCEMWIHA